MITLTNRTRQPLTFNLPHEIYCVPPNECACTFVPFAEAVTDDMGRAGVRMHQRRICASFGLLPGESKDLPERVLGCPEVGAAVDRRALRVIQLPDPSSGV